MLAVILGAGASYDSIREYPPPGPGSGQYLAAVGSWRPPLASQLFENRESFFQVINRMPLARPLIYDLRQLPSGISLEDELDRLQAKADDRDPQISRQLVALRFYLRDLLTLCPQQWSALAAGVTNYVGLVNRLESWARLHGMKSVVWVTFNYDVLLEGAIDDVAGFRPTKIDDYITGGNGHVVIKPHGSANWVRQITAPRDDNFGTNTIWAARRMIELAGEVALAEEITLDSGNYSRDGTGLFPALAVPIRQKQSFACPERHIDLLRSLLPKVTHVVIIGWAGNETHFVRLPGGLPTGVRFLVVAENAKTANEVWDRLGEAGRGHVGDLRLSQGGFTHLLTDGTDLRWFLRD